jgi:hypothetical protein
MGVSGRRHAPATLYTVGKEPRYPLCRRLGGPRSGLDKSLEEKSFASTRDRSSIAQYSVWLRTGNRTIEVRFLAEAKNISFNLLSRPALGPTQPPVQRVLEVLSPEVKRGRGVTLTTHPPSSAEVVNE